MAEEVQVSQTKVVVTDGVVTATLFDVLSADRVALMLFRGSAAALYAGAADNSGLISRDVKDLLLFPYSEV